MKLKILFPFLIVVLLGLMPVDLSLQKALQCIETVRACRNGQSQTDAYQHILEVEPWRVDLWEDLAEAQYLKGDYSDAILSYQRALDNDRLSIRGRVDYGYAMLSSGQRENAVAWWLSLVEADLAPVELYERLYDMLLNDLRITEAETLLQHWMEHRPEDAAVQFQAGLLSLLRSHETAAGYFDRAVELDATYAPVMRSFETAIGQAQLQDDIAYQQLLIGREAANLGYPLMGELLCVQAVQSNPAYAEAWAMLGELQQRNGRDGLPALEQAFSLAPDNVLVRSLLALYWQRQDDPEQAAAYFTRLAEQYPDEVLWQIEAANATAQAGDIPGGLQMLVDASAAYPQDVLVWTELAGFCADNRIELQTYGLKAARTALLLAPDAPSALLAMGDVLFSLNDLDSAERYYHQVLEIQPDETTALFQLGLIAVQQASAADARYYFNRVLELSPEYTELYALAQRNLEGLTENR